ncbi:MFS transporter [Saccharothrix syringae]|uniref:MFS transporter n=1 Tax=Saccharothrix syringae TaxID=103733 RepID=A0A5Q0H4W1_SACSY|nr:MFS transporter [Saccharothrix syringae]QFZ21189.1 MFS transporter [Saccharothrix syringae]
MSETQPVAGRADRIRGRTAVALAVVVSFWGLILVDEMVVNISLAQIAEALQLTQTELGWVVNAYLLPFGGLLLLGGRLGDILGKRRVFLVGMALYSVGCLARAVAPDAWPLIAARAVQGTGAALATPCVLALILNTFADGPLRRRAIGVYTIAGGTGAAVGLLVAGALGALGSWQLQMLLAGGIGLVLLAVTPAVVAETPRQSGRFDFPGALVSTIGLVALVYALANSQSGGWRTGPVIGCFVGAAVLLGLFVVITRRTRDPLLDLGLFTERRRVGAYLALLLMPGAQIGIFFFLGQYFQMVLGYTPMTVALAFLLVSVGMVGAAGLAARLEPRLGARTVIVLGALMLLGANLWLTRLGAGDSFWTAVLPSLLLVGAGLAFTTIPATIRATAGVDDEGSGSASSVVSAVQNVGSSLSLAIIVAVATTAGAAAAANPPADVPAEAVEGLVFEASMTASFATGAAFSLAIALVSLLVGGRNRAAAPPAAAPAPGREVTHTTA